MARGINRAILIGTLGKDPEVHYGPSGNQVTKFSIATNEEWKDKQTSEKKERTEWHNITTFGKLAEICGQYLKKGQQVYIEGSIRTDKYEKDGQTRYNTGIVADVMQMLGGRSGDSQNGGNNQQRAQPNQPPRSAPNTPPAGGSYDFDDDSIPF